MGPQSYDESKFTELVLYVAQKLADDPEGGAVQLNKVLWWAECAHVRLHGQSITGAEYQKLPNGPAPRRLLPVRNKLIENGDAQIELSTYMGRRQQRLVPNRPPDMTQLSPEETRLVDQVVSEIRGRNATELSQASHQEIGWRIVEDGETIPIETAFLADEAVVTPAIRDRAELLAEARRSSD